MAELYNLDQLLADKAEFERQKALLESQADEIDDQIDVLEANIAQIDALIEYAQSGFPDITNLDAPASLAAVSEVESARITWDAVADADNYVLERSLNPDFTDAEVIYSDSELEYVNTGLSVGTTYYYRVKAQGAGFADSVWADTSVLILSQIPDIEGFALTPGNNTVGGDWDDVVLFTGDAPDGYKVLRNTIDDIETAAEIDDVAVSNFTDNTAVNGTPYWYYVYAYKSDFVNSDAVSGTATPAP